MMVQALGLARVSTQEQGSPDHFSLQHQTRVIQEWSRQHQADLVDVIAYVQSGGANRQTLQQVLERVRQNRIEVVVVAELDRLSRDLVATMTFLEDLHGAGARLVSIKEGFDDRNPLGQMQTGLVSTFAQYFRAQLSAKVLSGQEERWKTGKYRGGPVPYGYRVNQEGYLVVEPDEAAVVRRIYAWYLEADWGYQRITGTLNRQGVPCGAEGQTWCQSRIRYILRNEVYAGRMVRQKVTRKMNVDGTQHVYYNPTYAVRTHAHPAIIDPGVFDRVQQRLRTKRSLHAHSRKSVYLVSGLVRCDCGSSMAVDRVHYICVRYKERRDCSCDNQSRTRIADVEQAILRALEAERHAVITDFRLDHWWRWSAQDHRADVWWQNLRRRVRQHMDYTERLERAKSAYLAGIFTLAEYESVQREAEGATVPDLPVEAPAMVRQFLDQTITWYREALAATDKTPYRSRLQSLVSAIICHPHEIPRVRFVQPEIPDMIQEMPNGVITVDREPT